MTEEAPKDQTVKRVVRATGIMGGAKIVSALLHLGGLAFAGRILGPQEFGILVLARGFAQTVSGLAKFQSWQAVIHYGASALHNRNKQGLADILSFTVLLDAATGILAMIAAMLMAPIIAPHVGITPDAVGLTILYCIAIPTMTAASPTGILRLNDRFDELGIQSLITPSVRLIAMSIVAFAGGSFAGIVAAWLVSDLIGDFYLWIAAGRELRRNQQIRGMRLDPRRMARAPGIWKFVLTTNANSTLDLAWGPLSNLLVGGMVGPVAAGAYRVAQTVIEGFARPGELATRSLYPELAKLQVKGSDAHIWSIVKKASLWGMVVGIAVALLLGFGSRSLIALLMGPKFDLTGQMLGIMAVALIPMIAAFPFESTLFALGAVGRALHARIAAGVFGLMLLIAGLEFAGVAGAAWAYAGAMALLGGGQGLALMRLRRLRR